MSEIFVQSIVLLASAVIVIRAEPALNRMSRSTTLVVRMAFHLLTLGAIAEIVNICVGDVPSWPTAIITAGTATFLLYDRRWRVLCQSPEGKPP